MKNKFCILLTLLITLLSIKSFIVMNFGKFAKDNFGKSFENIGKKLKNLDTKVYNFETEIKNLNNKFIKNLDTKVYNLETELKNLNNKFITNLDTIKDMSVDLVKKQLLDKQGGPSKIEIFPIKIDKQILNGLNYKVITAVKDVENKRIELYNSIISSEPFINPFSDGPKFTLGEKIDNEFENNQNVLELLKEFIKEQLEINNSVLEKINSIRQASWENGNELLYLINCDVICEGRSIHRYLLISLDSKGLSVVFTNDFPKN